MISSDSHKQMKFQSLAEKAAKRMDYVNRRRQKIPWFDLAKVECYIDVDYGQRDATGMTCLHHAARAFDLEAVLKIVDQMPALANVVTYVSSAPAAWTALMCCADVPPRAGDDAFQDR